MKQWVYLFSQLDEVEQYVGGGWDAVRQLLGGKGANLFEMTRIGLPVPPGFTVTTEACNAYLAAGGKFPEGMWDQELAALKAAETVTGKGFRDAKNPLLVSCRSGSKESMPGMMDTVLNIGLNDVTVEGIAELTGNSCFAWDAYRRLIEGFSKVVLGIPDTAFEHALYSLKERVGAKMDFGLTTQNLKELSGHYKAIVKKHKGFEFPQDPIEQLRLATEAVFKSWNGKRAVDYRRHENIPDTLGTAANIVTMVFGNMGNTSATGVAFTRNPNTGEKAIYGEYLINAQGEDVVAGIRAPEKMAVMARELPDAYAELARICEILEGHYHNMQDIEFTIERGKLWMLQTRNGRCTATATIRIAVDMADENLISNGEALLRVSARVLEEAGRGSYNIRVQHPTYVDMPSMGIGRVLLPDDKPWIKGFNASPGIAIGQVALEADLAEKWANEGKDVVLVRPFIRRDDLDGLIAAKGILTSKGGPTSHYTGTAREFGKPFVAGASELTIDLEQRLLTANGLAIREGDWISLDGTTGDVFVGRQTVVPNTIASVYRETLLRWADGVRADPSREAMEVWANADTPVDARRARSFGVQGIGLCRTEHMFFEGERLPITQQMILAEAGAERSAALAQLLSYLREDFYGLFEAMTNLPVVIRLLDPPLYEFMPDEERLLEEIIEMRARGETRGIAEKEALLKTIRTMQESNPMVGLRGVRLAVMLPDIYKMQVRAIFEAACEVSYRGFVAMPRVMIPMVSHVSELKTILPKLKAVAAGVLAERGVDLEYQFGIMIEVPRAALVANEMAQEAEFFSFGTNDLTQMTFGYSRDDTERNFLLKYVEDGILPANPFQTLDIEGVGRFMRIAVERGRSARPQLQIGICGEHAGDPESIAFCHAIGLDYVSCSPFRVPIARLSAAQAALRQPKSGARDLSAI